MAAAAVPQVTIKTLYHYPLSRSVRALWLLNELNVPCEVRRVKLMMGEGLAPEFMALNPNHAVPVLTYTTADGKELAMFESAALLRFIAAFCNGEHLMAVAGRHAPEVVADFEQTYAFAAVTMDMVLWNLRVVCDFHGRKPEHDDLVSAWAAKWNDEIMPQLAARLDKAEVMCPALGFSLADIMTCHCLTWARKYVGMKILARYPPSVDAFVKRMQARKALQDATKDRDLFEKDGSPKALL